VISSCSHLKNTLKQHSRGLTIILFFLLQLKAYLVDQSEHGHWINTPNEVICRSLFEQNVVAVIVTITFPTLLFRMEYICLYIVCRGTLVCTGCNSCRKVLENMFRVQELGVNVFGCKEVSADYKNLSRNVSISM